MMAAMPAHQRGSILNKAASIIASQADEIGRIMARENGKRVRAYSLTKAGKLQLEKSEERWCAVTAAVNRLLEFA